MNSTNIDTTMTVAEIITIIEKCAQVGVKAFHLGQLHIQFKETNVTRTAQVPNIEPIVVPPEVQNKIESQAREAIEKEELAAKEERLAMMAIEDPSEYEELMLSGDLVYDVKNKT